MQERERESQRTVGSRRKNPAAQVVPETMRLKGFELEVAVQAVLFEVADRRSQLLVGHEKERIADELELHAADCL
jgi:hypothetical protein